jgi:hypothetical protein
MSALRQQPTYALQQAMSALPPIATAKADVRKWSYPLIFGSQNSQSETEEIHDCLAPRHNVVIAELDKLANISWLKKQIAGEAPF